MGRHKKSINRPIVPDSKFNSPVITKFVSRMMLDGKKDTCTKIVYEALDKLQAKTDKNPLEVFLKALDNVKPAVEVKSRRVGGATYQVPVEIRDARKEALAMRWIIAAARSRSGHGMADTLAAELLDAFNSTGSAYKKKEDTHKMAEANKAFAHYRW
ncbi:MULTISPECIES: 30S ribosomal protein S7 [Treponema]|jgi:small subunit ribosomal protein S7|uniref:Small ribosomal subunit protein uS7 n=1 Tax=Treponema saccharophilum DSM 2985 TaxID=907348 RepID=H7ENE6_9SPIR|nr:MULTISPECIES: 30S ribosomal protein S7 [Treponema]EIC00874.1 SSU ribosomal protein S7P [Treponema saccharophilum DSM 2985]MBQ5538280.1 30S ribosomal protein S7 [Treponema sp.]BDC95206.1 30S ribosomal protein S7 [Treponema saccharophilum]